jgi:hypothetical protein
MTLRLRLVGITVLAVGLLLLLAALLGQRASEGLRQALVQASDQHLVNKLQYGAQSRLAIGLAVDQLETLQPLIEREKAGVPGILSIDLFSAGGTLLYSTDRSAVGLQVSPMWLEPLGRPGVWTQDGPAERTVGTRVENDLGAPALGVAVTLVQPTAPGHFHGWGFLQPSPERLALAALAALCLLLAGGSVALATAWMLRPWDRLVAALRQPSALAGPAAPGPAAALEGQARDRRVAWGRAERDIDDRLATLRAMDDVG